MRIEVKLPRYGANMDEGTIAGWLKQPGDAVAVGEGLCEIETEKVTAVYESPVAGVLVEIKVPAGDVLEVGGVLCVIDT